jgi:hypothetical protein
MARRREPRSQTRQRRSRGSESESTRHRIRLATFGTTVGIITSFVTIALGAFDLREKVGWVDAKDATTLTSSEYTQGVADICDEREDARAARRADALSLKRQIKSAQTFRPQRRLVLHYVERELERGDHALAAFAGLVPPAGVARDHKVVVRRWETNIGRVRGHRDRVQASTSRLSLVSVLAGLNRSVIETESRRVETGLHRLGGSACDIDRPKTIPQVFLPRPENHKPRRQQPSTSAETQPTRNSVPAQASTLDPDVSPPAYVDPPVQTPPTIEPPQAPPGSTDPPVQPPPGGGGGGGGGGPGGGG